MPKGVGDGLAKEAFGEVLSGGLKSQEDPVDSLNNGSALVLPSGLSKPGSGPAFTQLAFDPVEVLDLAQEPAGASGVVCALEGVMKFAPDVGPAGSTFEWSGMLFEEGLVGLVAVALDGALVVFGQDAFEALVAAPGVPVVGDATLFTGNFDDPKVALFGLTVAGGEVVEWGFVDL